MPLTERVEFKAVLQKGNRVQLPKLVRGGSSWKQPNPESFCHRSERVRRWETFYARMDRSGRITVPKLTLALLQSSVREKPSLTDAVMDVRLEPA